MAASERQTTKDPGIQWHPAFYQAIMLELEQYKDVLEFIAEHPLTTEPLRIDVLIIKKEKGVTIDKNIAAIFRSTNIVEYKSPEDYVSVNDFYKVYGYACLYASLTPQAAITDLTITFVESRYPKGLIAHLTEVRGYNVEKNEKGIYTVIGDIIPIQIIDSKELSATENLWLKDLNNGLDKTLARQLWIEIDKQGKAAQVGAYLEAVFNANMNIMREVSKMSDEALTMEKVLEEAGFTAIWEARGEVRGEVRGEEKGKIEVAKNAINQGLSEDTVVAITGLDLETIRKITQQK
jgi:hypothetical protein